MEYIPLAAKPLEANSFPKIFVFVNLWALSLGRVIVMNLQGIQLRFRGWRDLSLHTHTHTHNKHTHTESHTSWYFHIVYKCISASLVEKVTYLKYAHVIISYFCNLSKQPWLLVNRLKLGKGLIIMCVLAGI